MCGGGGTSSDTGRTQESRDTYKAERNKKKQRPFAGKNDGGERAWLNADGCLQAWFWSLWVLVGAVTPPGGHKQEQHPQTAGN